MVDDATPAAFVSVMPCAAIASGGWPSMPAVAVCIHRSRPADASSSAGKRQP
jgi:hypothetical protein